MARFLSGTGVWTEIRRRAKASRRLVAVVAYLGRRSDQLIRERCD